MSDLFNFNITLPLIYHLQEDNRGKIESYLEGANRKRRGRRRGRNGENKTKKLLRMYPKQIMQEIKESGAMLKAVSMTYALTKTAIESLDSNNPAAPYFEKHV